MPSEQFWISTAERVCLAILFVWVAALPLPFGSIIESARVALILVPLAVCFIATILRLYLFRDRSSALRPTRSWLIWAGGAVLFLAIAALQLVPLPPSMLHALSPESSAIWTSAERIGSLAGVRVSSSHPISIDPPATLFELFRVAALFATFTAAALLVRTPARRVTLAIVVCAAAFFEAMYAVREGALQRYQIWGWTNKLILNRISGTFVNPNHFAHYLAIALPMAIFIGAVAWYRAGARGMPLRRRLVMLVERQTILTAFCIIAVIVCIAGILLAQSRGALLSLGAGVLIVAALFPGRRMTRIALGAAAGLLLVAVLVLFLGADRTIARFAPSQFEQRTLVGRRIGIDAGVRIWQRFPALGSGLGTFDRAVFMEQHEDLGKTYHHAHNDYVEIAATAGTIGAVIAVAALFGGYVTLARMTFGSDSAEISWLRRAFQAAALMSITIAMVHSLFDFNFFIPSNPATLAAIAGAAVASVDHDRRTRR